MSLSKETRHPIQTFSSPKFPGCRACRDTILAKAGRGLPRAENNPAIEELIAEGTPEQVTEVKNSYTGQFLKAYLALK